MSDERTPAERLQITISAETLEYLKVLAGKGTHGGTYTAVARTLIEQGIRQAVREGFIKLRMDAG
jgi:hypothetical protein